MPDTYPQYEALPREWLVAPEDQPQYTELPGVGLDETMSLGAALSDAAVSAGRGDQVAIVHQESGTSVTFAELAQRSDALADVLAGLGVVPGSRVAVRAPNRPEGIIADIAVWKLGAVLVPIPHISRASELDFYLSDTEPVALVTDGRDPQVDMVVERATAAGLRAIVTFGAESPIPGTVRWEDAVDGVAPRRPWAVDLDAVAVVWHTGGTTGVPKGCYHTQRRFLLAGHSYGLATQSGPDQRWAAAAPIGHALGLIHHTIFTLLHGATIVMIERFTDALGVLTALDEHRVTTFTAIAATWAKLLEHLKAGDARQPSALITGYAMWQSSSSSEVTDAWRDRGIVLLNNFGSTAFATWVLIPRFGESVPQGALGSPAPGYDIRVLETETGEPAEPGTIGQLAVRGPSGLTYWRLPEKQRDDVRAGWVRVDDLVQDVGSEVYLYLGRTDFLISTAGNKVAPTEVEGVLASHPAVREVVVVGLPDPIRAEAVAAFVVVNAGFAESDALRKELQDLVKSKLSPYKYPRTLRFLTDLPRDHVGKVQPKLVRQQAIEELQGRGGDGVTHHVMRSVDRSARGLTYARRGAGRPIVLVHGWCLDRTVWLYQEQALVDGGFEVITPDLAGFGSSADLAGPFDLARHGADVAGLLDELGLDHAIVVGFAFGGAVLMSLPSYDRVAGVVAIGIPSAAGAPYPKMKAAMLRDWPLFAERSARAICGREQSTAALRWLGEVYASTPLASALAGADVLAAFEPAAVRSAWDIPFLFVHGEDDAIVSPSVSEQCAALFPGASMRIVPSSGHFVPWDQPTELAGIIADFAGAAR